MIPNFETISDFLRQSESEYQVFELGRQIRPVTQSCFENLENSRSPWPWPYLQQAWIGLVFWGENQDPQVWCLRFPLDEQGLLPPDQLGLFIAKLKNALADNLKAVSEGKKIRAVMDGNPFVIELPEDRMASFHAIIQCTLDLPPSEFYRSARAYFETVSQNPDKWTEIGIQGIADVCARHEEADVNQMLIQALPLLPDAPFFCVCQCLEHESINTDMSAVLSKILSQSLADPGRVASIMKAMSQSQSIELRQQDQLAVLKSDIRSSPEVLTTLATRCPTDLSSESLTLPFLEALALLPTPAFKRIMSEILFQASNRPAFMAAFRSPDRSNTLAEAIGELLKP